MRSRVDWFMRREEQAQGIKHTGRNPNYLRDAVFDPRKISFFTDSDLNSFFRASDVVVLVTPSPFIKSYLKRVRSSSMRDKLIINGYDTASFYIRGRSTFGYSTGASLDRKSVV